MTASAEVLLTPTGTDIDAGTAPVWNRTSFVDCLNCGWSRMVGDLATSAVKKEPGSERIDEALRKRITNLRDSNYASGQNMVWATVPIGSNSWQVQTFESPVVIETRHADALDALTLTGMQGFLVTAFAKRIVWCGNFYVSHGISNPTSNLV